MIFGLVINYMPIEVLFLYPPETPLMNVFPILTLQQSFNPSSFKSSSTLSYFWNYVISSLRSAANLKHSFGVNIPNRASYCITYPI
jgi:hypothetical protein